MCKCGVGEDARRRRSSGDEIKSKSPHEDLRCGEKKCFLMAQTGGGTFGGHLQGDSRPPMNYEHFTNETSLMVSFKVILTCSFPNPKGHSLPSTSKTIELHNTLPKQTWSSD